MNYTNAYRCLLQAASKSVQEQVQSIYKRNA